MSGNRIEAVRPQDLVSGLRKLADSIEAGKSEQRHLGTVIHTLPVPHPECPGMIGDIQYTGETAVISTRPMPHDIKAAVERFFHDCQEFVYPARQEGKQEALRAMAARERIVIPRDLDPWQILSTLGIRKEEVSPDSVILLTYPGGDKSLSDRVTQSAVQVSAMVARPVIMMPSPCEFHTMPLAEVTKLRDRLNEIIYDKERAKG